MSEWSDGLIRVLLGDCLTRLREMEDASVDALVTDPPAGISFMGVAWDTYRDGGAPRTDAEWDIAGSKEHPRHADEQARIRQNQGRAFRAGMGPIFAECLRVLKPGAHGLVWAIPRTSHWTATALEDAGFEVRDIVHHHFGSGFPKSLDVSKAIDKAAGAEREVVGVHHRHGGGDTVSGSMSGPLGTASELPLTSLDPEAARQWEGWGTALKPATEHWILVRKPLAAPNVAANVLAHGTGAINVDGCRIGTGAGGDRTGEVSADRRYSDQPGDFAMLPGPRGGDTRGRWPANLVLSHAEGCRPAGTRRIASNGREQKGAGMGYSGSESQENVARGHRDADGLETVEAWECEPGCPVAELDRQSGTLQSGFMAAGTQREGRGYRGGLGAEVRNDTHGDQGGASRFFQTFRYQAKASARERSAGLPAGARNVHPTVKPVELMRWLCRLVTPSGGMILDPFAGSGSTLVAAVLEGFRAIGIEQDPEYVETARHRVAWAGRQAQQTALGLAGDGAAGLDTTMPHKL